jgi:hypothetical protein
MTMIDEEMRSGAPAPTATTTTTPAVARTDTRRWLREQITSETAALMGAAWWVLFLISVGLQPEPTGSDPAWAGVLDFTLFGLIAAAAAGLVARRRWGLLASLGAAGLYTALVVACPTTGHHAIGAWWFGQMACVLALVGASAYALSRRAATG